MRNLDRAAHDTLLGVEGALVEEASVSAWMTSCGGRNEWPWGRGVFLARNERLIAWVNARGGDHLRVAVRNGGEGAGADMRQAYERLCAALDRIEQATGCEYAQHAR